VHTQGRGLKAQHTRPAGPRTRLTRRTRAVHKPDTTRSQRPRKLA
jgi:hypothetical protein